MRAPTPTRSARRQHRDPLQKLCAIAPLLIRRAYSEQGRVFLHLGRPWKLADLAAHLAKRHGVPALTLLGWYRDVLRDSFRRLASSRVDRGSSRWFGRRPEMAALVRARREAKPREPVASAHRWLVSRIDDAPAYSTLSFFLRELHRKRKSQLRGER